MRRGRPPEVGIEVMGERPAIDSRDYIVAFELRSIDDCPPDFELPPSTAGFDTGLFLPRGDRDWFGRCSYPPRILLLKGSALYLVSHPSTGEPPSRCTIEQISSVESGHMLLKGWLRFTGPGFDYSVRYNTRGFPPVLRFMRRFQDKLLRGARPRGNSEAHPGAGLDIKFGNALSLELDPGEIVLMQVFQPPREARSRSWLLPRRHWIAGDLLALTGRRLLWITDRERGSYSRYGSIASYAPFDAVRSIGLTSGRSGNILQVNLNGGSAWRIPITAEGHWDCKRVAEEFAAALEIQMRRDEANWTEVRR
jgi:hypothetical protein